MQNTLDELLETIAQLVVPNGIYRIQRNGLATYPTALPEKDKGVVQELYRTFEKVWVDTYDTNPYALFTNGKIVTGENSELTFHINPLEQVLYVNYNIDTGQSGADAIGYPITIKMTKLLRDRPLTDSILFLEALGQKEHIDCFYTGNVRYYEKEYSAVSFVWTRIKDTLKRELEKSHRQGALSEDEWLTWKIGLDRNEMIVNLRDPNVMNMPSISVYGEDAEMNGKEYATQATLGLIEAAFMFRHDHYSPFAQLL